MVPGLCHGFLRLAAQLPSLLEPVSPVKEQGTCVTKLAVSVLSRERFLDATTVVFCLCLKSVALIYA